MKDVFAFYVMELGFLTTTNEVNISSGTLIKTRYVIFTEYTCRRTGTTPTDGVGN